MFLPDVNIWLALAFESHFHHQAAQGWFDTLASDGCSFCRLTQQGFLRLATNPKTFGSEAVPLSDAWRMYDEFVNDPRVSFSAEPAGIEPLWRGYSKSRSYSPKVWNDAFLAAFAEAAGYELISFDRGFAQFTAVKCTILTSA
jgi:toxin-antitoxin system PIN domain toxin